MLNITSKLREYTGVICNKNVLLMGFFNKKKKHVKSSKFVLQISLKAVANARTSSIY